VDYYEIHGTDSIANDCVSHAKACKASDYGKISAEIVQIVCVGGIPYPQFKSTDSVFRIARLRKWFAVMKTNQFNHHLSADFLI
jgi:hypothetical protein